MGKWGLYDLLYIEITHLDTQGVLHDTSSVLSCLVTLNVAGREHLSRFCQWQADVRKQQQGLADQPRLPPQLPGLLPNCARGVEGDWKEPDAAVDSL